MGRNTSTTDTAALISGLIYYSLRPFHAASTLPQSPSMAAVLLTSRQASGHMG